MKDDKVPEILGRLTATTVVRRARDTTRSSVYIANESAGTLCIEVNH
jgi:hypothetical protein